MSRFSSLVRRIFSNWLIWKSDSFNILMVLLASFSLNEVLTLRKLKRDFISRFALSIALRVFWRLILEIISKDGIFFFFFIFDAKYNIRKVK